jgi:disulfide bond formation protein DsbB
VGPFVRLGNDIGAAGIATILLAAFGLQFGLKELPCLLCTLQRVAFVLCGFGFVLNLRFGMQPLHYGLILLSALFGVVVSGYQVVQHIAPGAVPYGAPILGMHLDTWSLVLFFAVIAVVALLLMLSGRPEHDRSDHQAAMRFRGIHRFAASLIIAVTLANAASSFAQCGPIECPDKPAGYWISKYLP